MKKVLLLHGTQGNSTVNWFPWLKNELEQTGLVVWVPDLPQADEPNIERYNQYIFAHHEWVFDDATTIVGHSSGSLAALGILQNLPNEVVVERVILIGAFKDDLGWKSLSGLFEQPFDFEKITQHAKEFVLIHSDNDPYCPLDHAEYLAGKLNGKLLVLPGQKHFSEETNPKYTTFPYLKELLLSNISSNH